MCKLSTSWACRACHEHTSVSGPPQRGDRDQQDPSTAGRRWVTEANPTHFPPKTFQMPELCYLTDIYGYFHLSWELPKALAGAIILVWGSGAWWCWVLGGWVTGGPGCPQAGPVPLQGWLQGEENPRKRPSSILLSWTCSHSSSTERNGESLANERFDGVNMAFCYLILT